MTSRVDNEIGFLFKLCLPYCLRLPDKSYKLRYGAGSCVIETHRVDAFLRKSSDSPGCVAFKAVSGELTEASGADIPGAMLRYTVATIMFGKRLHGPEVAESVKLAARDRALLYLNHFLDLYRVIVGDSAIRHLTRSEFHSVRAGQALHVRTHRRQGTEGILEMGVMFDEKDPVSIGTVTLLTDEQLRAFEQRLSAGQTPPLPDLLLLNAEGSLSRGDNKLAVVDAHAAFDILTEAKAKERLVSAGKTGDEAEWLLEPMSTARIWSAHLESCIDAAILREIPYQKWRDSWRVLRNRVVHDAYEPTDNEATQYLMDLKRLCAFTARLQFQAD